MRWERNLVILIGPGLLWLTGLAVFTTDFHWSKLVVLIAALAWIWWAEEFARAVVVLAVRARYGSEPGDWEFVRTGRMPGLGRGEDEDDSSASGRGETR